MNREFVEVDGRRLALANLTKVLYPACGFTKAHVLAYYRGIATCILPHLRDRALTLKRYPDGVAQPFFFEKRCPSHRPPWVATAAVGRETEPLTACLVNDLATLIWVVNLASLELHVPLARAATPATPDALVFDLDPGAPADVLSCARLALLLREFLLRLRLHGFVKTSGLKGLHLYVPLNQPGTTFAATRQFSRAVAQLLEKNYPALVTSKMAKEERNGRVFINWSQNDASKTMVCAYSLRAREEPYVSAPLTWEDVEQAVQQGDAARLRISPAQAVERVASDGDLFRAVLTLQQQLPHL